MTSLQVEYFLAVAEHMSFSAAAKKKFVSQPSISKHIRNLELELDATLFDRTAGRDLKLTHIGQLYLEFFRSAARRIEEIREDNQNYLRGLLGEVRIATVTSMNASDLLFEVLESCSQKHPNINIQVSFLPFADMEQALLNGQVDLIIHLRDFLSSTDGIVVQKLTDVPKGIFYHRELAPLVDRELRPEDFRDTPFLVLDPATFPLVKPNVVAYCREFGFTPTIRRVPNIDSMIGGVGRKQGVAVFDTMMDFDSDKIRFIPLPSPHEVVLAWKKGSSASSVHIVANELLFHFQNGSVRHATGV